MYVRVYLYIVTQIEEDGIESLDKVWAKVDSHETSRRSEIEGSETFHGFGR